MLVSEGLGPRGARNSIIPLYTCRALQKLAGEGLSHLEIYLGAKCNRGMFFLVNGEKISFLS